MVKGTPSVFDDLDSLRLSPEVAADIAAAHREMNRKAPKRLGRSGAFIGGPFPLSQFLLAMALPGKALGVWQIVHHQVRMTRKPEVTLPAALLRSGEVNRFAKARALRDLERVGLIRVRREPGQVPRISLVQLPENEG